MKTLLRSLIFVAAVSAVGTAVADPYIQLNSDEIGVCNWASHNDAFVTFNSIDSDQYIVYPGECRPFLVGNRNSVRVYGSYDSTFDTYYDPYNVVSRVVRSGEIFDIKPRHHFDNSVLKTAQSSAHVKPLADVSVRKAVK